MAFRIGIMGFGRIGRNIFRILNRQDAIEVVAISDIAEPAAIEYLLKFDTVHGRFPDSVSVKGNSLYVKGKQIALLQARQPGEAPWKDFGVDLVVEATAKYQTRAWLEKHLQAGAKRVILTAPAPALTHDDVDAVIIRGINDELLQAKHRIISTSSVTANTLALILNILDHAFGVERAFFTTIHAYTNDQRLADVPHTDLRRSRAAAENIIPTETQVPKALENVLPRFSGRIDGMAMNVPVADGSNVDLVTETTRAVTVESVNEVVKSAAGSTYRGIVSYMDAPIVSSDVIGDKHSAIFDSLATQVIGENLLKTVSWYDNGWGYAQRVVEIMQRIATFNGERS